MGEARTSHGFGLENDLTLTKTNTVVVCSANKDNSGTKVNATEFCVKLDEVSNSLNSNMSEARTSHGTGLEKESTLIEINTVVFRDANNCITNKDNSGTKINSDNFCYQMNDESSIPLDFVQRQTNKSKFISNDFDLCTPQFENTNEESFFDDHIINKEIDEIYGKVVNKPLLKHKALVKRYYLYYMDTARINVVSKNAFIKSKGKIMTLSDGFRIRIIGEPDSTTLKLVRSRFQAEGLSEVYNSIKKSTSDFLAGVKLLKDIIMNLGKLSNGWESVCKHVDRFLVLDLIQFFINVYESFERGFSVRSIVNLCIDLYKMVMRVKGTPKTLEAEGGLETLGLGVASLFLPKKIMELFRNMSLFSGARLADDTSYLHSFLPYIQQFVQAILDMFPDGFIFKKEIKNLLDGLSLGEHHAILSSMETFLMRYRKDKELLTQKTFRISCQELLKKAQVSKDLMEWTRRSQVVKSTLEDFTNMCKNFHSYEEATRIEPGCFVFEGPPGCLKSVTMNSIIKILGMSSYAHHIKAMTDGKDWYDSYNNESVFYMDDVGQQGISQYRTIINLISPVKLPLDCARAENKDTKFFTSELVLLTTNNFSNLHGLTKQDCISDITALWRRGYVFDFSETRREGGVLKGKVSFKFYNLAEGKFINKLPSDFIAFCDKKNLLIEPSFNIEGEMDDFYLWCCDIIMGLNQMKKSQNVSNTLSDQKVDKLRQKLNFAAEGEGFFENPVYDKFLYWRKVVCDYMIQAWDSFYAKIGNYLPSFFKAEAYGDSDLGSSFITYLICMVIYILVVCSVISLCDPKKKAESETTTTNFFIENNDTNVGTVIESVKKQMFEGTLVYKDESIDFHCLVSGHMVVVPSHAIMDGDLYLIVYQNKQVNHRIYDHIPVKRVFVDRLADVAVLSLPMNIPSPMKNLHRAFTVDKGRDLFLVNKYGSVPLNKVINNQPGHSLVYTFIHKNKVAYRNTANTSTDFSYKVRGKGLCGTVVIDKVCGIKGMHVAGDSASNIGVAIAWSDHVLQEIKRILADDNSFLLNCDMSSKDIPNFSGIKLEKNFHSSIPKKTKFIPSDLHGVFDVERVPADLTIYGDMTVKDISKKAYAPVRYVDPEDIEFAKATSRFYLDKYTILSDNEIIKGTPLLASLNKDSSNGMFCTKDKKDYIDFERGITLPHFDKQLKQMEEDIINGVINLDDFVWKETLKDELRDKEKTYPRSFRISRLHIMFLTKKYFGNFVSHIMAKRSFNKIMIGCNPVVDWPVVYSYLANSKGVWAADFSKWDGSMLPQVQCAVNDIVLVF